MYGSDPDIIRGNHANRYTKFVLINVAGSSKVLVDDGNTKEVIVLDKPRMRLYLGPMVWEEMYDFSTDSILLVLASEHYIENEYITCAPVNLYQGQGINSVDRCSQCLVLTKPVKSRVCGCGHQRFIPEPWYNFAGAQVPTQAACFCPTGHTAPAGLLSA